MKNVHLALAVYLIKIEVETANNTLAGIDTPSTVLVFTLKNRVGENCSISISRVIYAGRTLRLGGNSINPCYGFGVPEHEVVQLKIEIVNGELDPWSGIGVTLEMNDYQRVEFATPVTLPTAAGETALIFN